MVLPNILHVELDALFACVEQARDPALRGRPVVVGNGHESRGVVACASHEARRCGVRAGMPIVEARRLCPDGVYLPGNFSEYRRFSEAVFELLEQVSPRVERASLGEGYLDVSGCERLYGSWSAGPLGRLPFRSVAPGLYVRAEQRAVPPAERTVVPEPCRWVAAVALWIRRIVKARAGLNVSVGCAANKLAARTASGFARPNGLALVRPGAEAGLFLRLPLEKVPGLGRAVLARLRKWNVRTVAQARRLPCELFRKSFGEREGLFIYGALRGQGETALARPSRPRSVRRETSFWHASNERAFVEAVLFSLSEQVGNALRRERLAGRTVRLRLRYEDFSVAACSRSLREPTNADLEIFAVARGLLRARWCKRRRLRLVGVSVSRLQLDDRRQSKLFDDGGECHRRLDLCLDRLREKFGSEVVRRGPLAAAADPS